MQPVILPHEIPLLIQANGIKKASMPLGRLFLLAALAGMFIALSAMGASATAHAFTSPAVQKLVTAAVFPMGLILVLLCGADLFTGDCLVAVACYQKKVKWFVFARLLLIVWLGNLAGSLFIALLAYYSPQWNSNAGLLGAYTLKIAADKTTLSFFPAIISGIGCNLIVCMAVWAASAAPTASGKVICSFFPLIIFVLSGFEHCVANMYYIPAGLLAKANPLFLHMAKETFDIPAAKLDGLSLFGFLVNNLLPVTLGNILGGAFFIGGAYTLAYLKN